MFDASSRKPSKGKEIGKTAFPFPKIVIFELVAALKCLRTEDTQEKSIKISRGNTFRCPYTRDIRVLAWKAWPFFRVPSFWCISFEMGEENIDTAISVVKVAFGKEKIQASNIAASSDFCLPSIHSGNQVDFLLPEEWFPPDADENTKITTF